MDWLKVVYLAAFAVFILLLLFFTEWLFRLGRKEVDRMVEEEEARDKDSEQED